MWAWTSLRHYFVTHFTVVKTLQLFWFEYCSQPYWGALDWTFEWSNQLTVCMRTWQQHFQWLLWVHYSAVRWWTIIMHSNTPRNYGSGYPFITQYVLNCCVEWLCLVTDSCFTKTKSKFHPLYLICRYY